MEYLTRYHEKFQEYDYFDNGYFVFKGKKMQPPLIRSCSKKIAELEVERHQLLKKYFALYEQVLNSATPDKFKTSYDKLLDNIEAIDNSIKELTAYLTLVNDEKEMQKKKVQNDIDAHNTYLKQLANVLTNPDIVQEYVKTSKKIERSYKLLHEIDSLPIDGLYEAAAPTAPAAPVAPVAPIAPKKLRKDQTETITHNIKNKLLSNFKFKTHAECSSAKRTAEYFMTKDDIIKQIQNEPELLAHMPKGYKSLSKDKLCEYLFAPGSKNLKAI